MHNTTAVRFRLSLEAAALDCAASILFELPSTE